MVAAGCGVRRAATSAVRRWPPARSRSRRCRGSTRRPPTWPPPASRVRTARRIRLTDARPAVEGTDYRELTSHTNEDLDADNGQYFDGVTDDGLILFRDGPRSDQLYPRFALMDPATGEKDWLPELDVGQAQPWAVELSVDRLVLDAPRRRPDDRRCRPTG